MGFFQLEVSDSTRLEVRGTNYVPLLVEISGKENVRIELRRMVVGELRIQQAPDFPGGMAALLEYIQKNMRVPRGAPKGVIHVQIKIDSTGAVIKDSVKIIKSLNKACDWEAVRVMKKSPKWSPGRGYNVPIMVPIKIN